MAIVPDSSGGGYVLIVQPTGAGGNATGQVQVPVSGAPVSVSSVISNTTQNAVSLSHLNSLSNSALSQEATATAVSSIPSPTTSCGDTKMDSDMVSTPLTRIKQERLEAEKPNDISVYDFDDGLLIFQNYQYFSIYHLLQLINQISKILSLTTMMKIMSLNLNRKKLSLVMPLK